MVELNTGSIIQGEAGENKTFTSVSTNIIIKVGDTPVGAIRSLSVNENRRISMIDEVGTDGHVDSVPSQSTNITGSCQRTRFNNLRMAAAFSRGYVHVHSQRIPFDIDIIDIFAGSDPGTHITTTIKNVWISKISYTFRSDDFVIVEDMDWEAEAISSILGVVKIAKKNGFILDIILATVFLYLAFLGHGNGWTNSAIIPRGITPIWYPFVMIGFMVYLIVKYKNR